LPAENRILILSRILRIRVQKTDCSLFEQSIVIHKNRPRSHHLSADISALTHKRPLLIPLFSAGNKVIQDFCG